VWVPRTEQGSRSLRIDRAALDLSAFALAARSQNREKSACHRS
jgi:hypothetical protein